MDGTAHVTLFSTELGSPLALTVDVASGKLFWTDTDLKRIDSADFDGGNRHVIIDNKLVMPIGIAVAGEFVYWADKDQQLIERAHKVSGGQRETLKSRVAQLNGLLAVDVMLDVMGRHPCSRDNGGCPYLCVGGKNMTSRCSCPIGLMLKSDEVSCAEPPTCAPNQFTCRSWSTDCIPLVWKCDGYPDCEDQSDELDCPKCSRNEFRCRSGQCVARKQRCDGQQQCQDDSDEADCPPCGDGAFECTADKTCIDKLLRCNGAHDCSDSQDEYDCSVINRPLQGASGSNEAQYIISVVVVFVVIIVVLAVVVMACRRKSQQVMLDDSRDIMLVKPLNPASSSQQSTPPNTLLSSRSEHSTSLNTAGLHSSGPLLYDRNHVTGASSSSSAVTRYPHETLNPPPSPVTTDTSRRAPYYLSPSPPSTMSHRHYKKLWRHPPPQPTPCSTDVFEDSDPYCSKDYCGDDSTTELNYDSDPFYPPPHPSPRSHYFSDDEPSFPPSPSTERSFFNPYPPPPSPVGLSDCWRSAINGSVAPCDCSIAKQRQHTSHPFITSCTHTSSIHVFIHNAAPITECHCLIWWNKFFNQRGNFLVKWTAALQCTV